MNVVKFIVLLCFVLGIGLDHVQAQSKIGQILPDFEFSEMTNNHKGIERISQLKGKFVILDFWSEYCSTCIRSFPKVSELSKRYSDQIQFLMVGVYVNPKRKNRITEIYADQLEKYNLVMPNFPDTTLANYFDIYGVPHVVILDPTGKIIASTDHSVLTESLLDDLIAGKSINFKEKETGRSILSKKENTLSQILSTENVNNMVDLKLSIFTGERQDLNFKDGQIYNNALHIGHQYYNWTGDELIKRVFATYWNPNTLMLPESRIEWIVKDRSKLLEKKYCFELRIPNANEKLLITHARNEILQALSLQVNVEKKIKRCLVLVHNGDTMLLKQKNQKREFEIIDQDFSELFRGLAYNLNATNYPFLDETNLKDRKVSVSFNLDRSLPLVERFQKELSAYGFSLIYVDREVDVLVFRDST